MTLPLQHLTGSARQVVCVLPIDVASLPDPICILERNRDGRMLDLFHRKYEAPHRLVNAQHAARTIMDEDLGFVVKQENTILFHREVHQHPVSFEQMEVFYFVVIGTPAEFATGEFRPGCDAVTVDPYASYKTLQVRGMQLQHRLFYLLPMAIHFVRKPDARYLVG